jgi:iron(III) transport system permease protein
MVDLAARYVRVSLSPFRLVAAAAALALCFFVVYPLARAVFGLITGSQPGGGVVSSVTSAETLTALWHTALLVAAGGGIALLVGSVFAWLNERTDARIGWAAEILPLISMFVPSLAGAIGWVFLGDQQVGLLNTTLRGVLSRLGIDLATGPINIYSWYGLTFMYAVYLTPFAYLTIATGLQSLDPALEEASKVGGAGVLRTLRKVTLPSLKPAMGGAVLLVVTMGFALFSIPVIIGTRADISVLPVLIVQDVTQAYPPNVTSALGRSGLLLAIVLVAWLFQRRLVGTDQAYATIGGKPSRTSIVPLRAWRLPARVLMVGYLLIASVLPFLGLVLVSLQRFWSVTVNWDALTTANYRTLVGRGAVQQGLQDSLILGALCATAVVVFAVLVTHLVELRPTLATRVADGILKAPAAITHIVFAIALIIAFGGPPTNWTGTPVILIAAYMIMYFPQASFYTAASMQQIGRPLVEASAVSGAHDARTVRKVLTPLMAPGLIAAWALIFVLMFGDVTASAMLGSTSTPVVGFVMLDEWQSGTFPAIAALGVVMTVVSTVVVLAALRIRDRFRLDR